MKKLFLPKVSRRLSLILFGLLLCSNVFAQRFTSLADTAYSAVSLNSFHDVTISIEKNDTAELVLKWKTIENNLPNEWDLSLCDFPNCYLGVPDSGTMDPLTGNQGAFIKISFNPMTKEARGTARFYVYEESAPNEGDTMTFIIDAGQVGIQEAALVDVNVWPNPTLDYLNISGVLGCDYAVYDCHGRSVLNSVGIQSDQVRRDLSGIEPGIYSVVVSKDGQRIRSTRLFKQ